MAHPLSGSAYAYAKAGGNLGGRSGMHPPDRFLLASGRQFGILVTVHLLPRPVPAVWQLQPYRLEGDEQPVGTLLQLEVIS